MITCRILHQVGVSIVGFLIVLQVLDLLFLIPMNLLTNLFMSVLVTLQDTDVANLDVLVVTIILDILNIPRNDKRRILVLTKLCNV